MPTDNNSSYKAARLGLVEADAALRTLAEGLRQVGDDGQFATGERQAAQEQSRRLLALADRLRGLQAELLEMIGARRLPESTADLRQAD